MLRLPAVLIATGLSLAAARPVQGPADLNDFQMIHVAFTASDIDTAYAHLALARSDNPAVRQFAETMIRDHTAVNAQLAALTNRLGLRAQDNPMSRQLLQDATRIKGDLSRLRGAAFDTYYVNNELTYHRLVNGAVADGFIPNVKNPAVKQAFQGALVIFRGHERHAASLMRQVAAR